MNSKITKLQELGKMCITIGEIPASYKISMTYEEQLLWFCNYLESTIIPAINNNAEILEELKKEIEGFDDHYEELLAMMNELRLYVNTTITDLKNDVNFKLEEQYNEVVKLMNDYKLLFTSTLNSEIAKVNKRIDDIELGEIDVYNPTTGHLENINKVLNDIYDAVRYDALTVNEFESLDYTAQAFDNVEITAYNFDNNGKSILG